MPPDRDRIDWKLITDLEVGSLDQAIEKVQWYAMRWKIEVFHKILKSGCRAEQSRRRTSERLTNLVGSFGVNLASNPADYTCFAGCTCS
jgi:hypothetical protein